MAQILPQFTDQLGNIRYFVENPKAIAVAHEEMRKQQALTDDEKKKADEARELIKNQPKILSDIEAKNAAVKAAQEQSEKDAQEIAKKRQALDKDSASLNDRMMAHEAAEKKLLELKATLDQQKAKTDSDKITNEAEKIRLLAINAALNIRSKKLGLLEEAANL